MQRKIFKKKTDEDAPDTTSEGKLLSNLFTRANTFIIRISVAQTASQGKVTTVGITTVAWRTGLLLSRSKHLFL